MHGLKSRATAKHLGWPRTSAKPDDVRRREIVDEANRFAEDRSHETLTPGALVQHAAPGRNYVNITDQVEELVKTSGVQQGLALVNAMHITASVYINDAESGLIEDYDEWLEKLGAAPLTSHYRHNRTGEDNADAHMKRQIMGREVVAAITDGKLDFWAGRIFLMPSSWAKEESAVPAKIIGE